MKVMKRYCDYDYDHNCIVLFDATDCDDDQKCDLNINWISNDDSSDAASKNRRKKSNKSRLQNKPIPFAQYLEIKQRMRHCPMTSKNIPKSNIVSTKRLLPSAIPTLQPHGIKTIQTQIPPNQPQKYRVTTPPTVHIANKPKTTQTRNIAVMNPTATRRKIITQNNMNTQQFVNFYRRLPVQQQQHALRALRALSDGVIRTHGSRINYR